MGRVFSTGKFDMIRVSQYLINGLKGGCKGHKYSKNLKKPLSSSTGMTSETLIYHNACNLKSSDLSKFTSNRRAKKYLNLCRIKKTVDEFEGAPPPQPTPFAGDKSPDDLRLEALLRHSNNEIANWARSHPSQVTLGSPENPLLGLTREEYYAYK